MERELEKLEDETAIAETPHIALLEALCHLLNCREKFLISSLYRNMHENKKRAMHK